LLPTTPGHAEREGDYAGSENWGGGVLDKSDDEKEQTSAEIGRGGGGERRPKVKGGEGKF